MAVSHEQQRHLGEHHEHGLFGAEIRDDDRSGDNCEERVSVPLRGVKRKRNDLFQRGDADGNERLQADDHGAPEQQDGGCGNKRDLQGDGDRRDELSVAVSHGEQRHLGEYHEHGLFGAEIRDDDRSSNNCEERVSVPLRGVERERNDLFQRGDADGDELLQADDHGAAVEQKRGGGRDGEVYRGGDWRDRLPVAVLRIEHRRLEEQQRHRREDRDALRHGGELPQRVQVPLQGVERERHCDFERGDADGDGRGEADDYDAAVEQKRGGGHNGEVHRGGDGRYELSVAVPHEQQRQLE